MQITQEQVERLRARTGLSYERARALLEQAGGDLLEALILLERQGGTGQAAGSFYSTRPDSGVEAPPASAASGSLQKTRESRPGFWDWLTQLLDAVWDLLRHSVVNRLEIWRRGEMMSSMPVLILVLLVIVAFWLTAALLLFGLLFGCTYRFSGPDLNRDVLRQASSAVHRAVDRLCREVHRAVEKGKNKKH